MAASFVPNIFGYSVSILFLYGVTSLDLSSDSNGESLLDSFGSLLDTVVDFAGENNECHFTCPDGIEPRPKEGHRPSSNGCGALGLELDTSKLPQMTKCCDDHDLCYDTCKHKKQVCDRKFKKCLTNMCDDMTETLSEEEYEGCQATAELMYKGTAILGCTSYKDAQTGACDCTGTKPFKKKRHVEF